MPAMSVVRRAGLFRRTAPVAILCATLITTAACGSDSGGGSGSGGSDAPSQAQIVSRLRNDAQLNKAFEALVGVSGANGSSAKAKAAIDQIKTKAYPCFAKGLQQTASAAKLREYVDGDRSAEEVLDPSARKKFAAASRACLVNVVPK